MSFSSPTRVDDLEGGGVTARLLPCHRWSARGTGDRSHALWCSFAVGTPVGRLLVCGDTGCDDGRPFRADAAHGHYRLAIIPIGAYAPAGSCATSTRTRR